jgi:hypothetical protein
VTATLVAVESMTRRVNMDFDSLVPRRPYFVDLRKGDRMVGLAKMELHRAVGFLARNAADAAAVLGRRGGKALESRRRDPGEKAAPAIADDADLARGLHRVARGGDIDQRRTRGRG